MPLSQNESGGHSAPLSHPPALAEVEGKVLVGLQLITGSLIAKCLGLKTDDSEGTGKVDAGLRVNELGRRR